MIFCVEDDAGIRNMMIYTLSASGFEVVGFGDSTDFFEALKTTLPELIMLDIMLPTEDGLTILKKLKASPKTANIPVILATAKGTEYDKVIGLDSGADDYLAKPFGMMEMAAHVKAVLRRTAPQSGGEILSLGDLCLNQLSHTVTVGGERVLLTVKEYELLQKMITRPGMVYTRDQLLSDIWGYDFDGETRTVDVHIRTLREKLGACAAYIETVRGVGYRLEEKP